MEGLDARPPPAPEGFLRVTSRTRVSARGDEARGDGGVRLALRSGGATFPPPPPRDRAANDGGDGGASSALRPPLAVGLAHHVPSGDFFLLSFTPRVLPCRLARFTRGGKSVGTGRNAASPHLWGDVESSVLAGVAERMGPGDYFGGGGDADATEGDGSGVGGDEGGEGGGGERDCEVAREAPEAEGGGEGAENGGDGSEGEDDNDESYELESDEDDEERDRRLLAGCLRLATSDDGDDPDEEQDAGQIRALIIDELLNPPEGMRFVHPDPNFLMPLARSVSKELRRWRDLVTNAPYPSFWPELPDPAEFEEAKPTDERPVEGGEGDESLDSDAVEIIDGRGDTFGLCVELCERALGRMASLLSSAAAAGDDDGSGMAAAFPFLFKLGRESLGSLAAVQKQQLVHRDRWPEMNDAIRDACSEERICDCYDDAIAALEPWTEGGEGEDSISDEDGDSKQKSADDDGEDEDSNGEGEGEGEGEDVGAEEKRAGDNEGDDEGGDDKSTSSSEDGACPYAVANEIVHSFLAEDEALLQCLSGAASAIERCLKAHSAGVSKDCLREARDCVESARVEVAALKERAKKDTAELAVRFAKLWNAPTSDDEDDEEDSDDSDDGEEEPWLERSLAWKDNDFEAHLSFGWRVSEGETEWSSSTRFSIDHMGFVAYLKKRLGSLHFPHRRCDDGYESNELDRLAEQFERKWTENAQPYIDRALCAIDKFLEAGDLHNASLLAACLGRVLCDGSVVFGVLRDSDRDAKEYVLRAFRCEMGKVDKYVVKIALAYFELPSSNARAGAHWFYDVLKSGVMYHPAKEADVNWSERSYCVPSSPTWQKFAHVAAAIFSGHGWEHPLLLRTMNGHEKSSKKWLKMEAPIVIKERHDVMKSRGETRSAISLARITSGDAECMHFLFANGLANDAIAQASASGNLGGLARLSKDLISTNEMASVVCMQAHLLGALEKVHDEGKGRPPTEGINNAVELFQSKWPKSRDVEAIDHQTTSSQCMPPLSVLSTIGLARALLRASKSVHKMQALLNNEKFARSGMSPLALVSITTITRAMPRKARNDPFERNQNMHKSIKHFLSKTKLLVVKESEYSGFLTKFGYFPVSLGRDVFLQVCCALYESARFLMDKGCNMPFCLDLAVFASVQISVLTGGGCNIALDIIESARSLDDRFSGGNSDLSPLNSLSACLAALFKSKCTGRPGCNKICNALLDTFLHAKIADDRSIHSNYFIGDARKACVWVAVAYVLLHNDAREAGAALFAHIMTSKPEFYRGFDCCIVGQIKTLSEIDTKRHLFGEEHTMNSFARCQGRRRVTKSERHQMLSAFVESLLGATTCFGPPVIAACVTYHSAIDPTFWRNQEASVRLFERSIPTGLSAILSKRSSLLHACTVMFYIDSHRTDSRHVLLEIGLNWLRNALSSQDGNVMKFDMAEDLSDWTLQGKEENPSSIIHEKSWRVNGYDDRASPFADSPVYSALAMIFLLRKHTVEIKETSPQLANTCQETLALCSALDFLIRPDPNRLDAVGVAQSELGLAEVESHSHLRPENLVVRVLDADWTKGPYDIPIEPRDDRWSRKETDVPCFLPRVMVALKCGKVNEAAALCSMVMCADFWTKLSKRSQRNHEYAMASLVCETLHACLLTVKGAAVKSELLPDEFINQALHLILSMNWLQACDECSPDRFNVPNDSCQLIVSVENQALLHETALMWSEFLGERKRARFAHCLDVICCISKCIMRLEEKGEAQSSRKRSCEKCSLRGDKQAGNSGREPDARKSPEQHEKKPSTRDERAQTRKKRKLLGEQPVDPLSDFVELEKYIAQLHLEDAREWCKDAVKRMKGESKKKSDWFGFGEETRAIKKGRHYGLAGRGDRSRRA